MFGIKNFKLVKELKNIKLQTGWLSFSKQNETERRNEFFKSLMEDNKFVEEDLKLRLMVEEMLVKEFGEKIKETKSYDFLKESVIKRLKQKQLGNEPIEENK